VCDVVFRTQVWLPLLDDEGNVVFRPNGPPLVDDAYDGYYTSTEARAAAGRIFEILGITRPEAPEGKDAMSKTEDWDVYPKGEPVIGTVNLFRMVGELPDGSAFTLYMAQVWRPTVDELNAVEVRTARGWNPACAAARWDLGETVMFITSDFKMALAIAGEYAWDEAPASPLGAGLLGAGLLYDGPDPFGT
jgi:hypothetical protein